MLHVVKRDIFSMDVDAIVNPVNCVGVMGGGLAYAFKVKFPRNYELYHAACAAGNLKIGQLLITHEQHFAEHPSYERDLDVRVVNFPTKDHYRNPSTLATVSKGLDTLVAWLEESTKEVESIAIPALGCGLGGLDWNVVRPMIEERLAPLVAAFPNLEVYLIEPTGF